MIETMTETRDLTQLSDNDLRAELKRREQQKDQDRKAYKKLTKETVTDVFTELISASTKLQEVKALVFKEFQQLLAMKEDIYGVKEGQRSHTFSTTAGTSITLGFRINEGWDDTATAGEEKVNQFIGSLAKDDNSKKLVNAINKLLKKDAKGNLKANRVIELKAMADEFNNTLFSDGVDIIMKAYKPVRSCYFIEASSKNKAGKEVSLPLSISSVKFPEDTELPFFNYKSEIV